MYSRFPQCVQYNLIFFFFNKDVRAKDGIAMVKQRWEQSPFWKETANEKDGLPLGAGNDKETDSA